MSATEVVDVVIVGGGAAGLYAAEVLSKNTDLSVVVLEAEDRFGGRIHTVQRDGGFIELGAQWIHGKDENPLWKYVVENQVPVELYSSRACSPI
jgi:protoporphyrinogen oxidase